MTFGRFCARGPAHDRAIERTPGTTHITGTATSAYGVYNIDVTR